MLAYIAIVALISPQQYDTEKTIAQMRASRIKVDAALNAWIDCSNSRVKPRDSQSFKAAGEFADKQLQNMDTRLIDTYAERIMAFRRKQR